MFSQLIHWNVFLESNCKQCICLILTSLSSVPGFVCVTEKFIVSSFSYWVILHCVHVSHLLYPFTFPKIFCLPSLVVGCKFRPMYPWVLFSKAYTVYISQNLIFSSSTLGCISAGFYSRSIFISWRQFHTSLCSDLYYLCATYSLQIFRDGLSQWHWVRSHWICDLHVCHNLWCSTAFHEFFKSFKFKKKNF